MELARRRIMDDCPLFAVVSGGTSANGVLVPESNQQKPDGDQTR